VTWQVTTDGAPTGVINVKVGGALYDVEFVDGTCVALLDGCNPGVLGPHGT